MKHLKYIVLATLFMTVVGQQEIYAQGKSEVAKVKVEQKKEAIKKEIKSDIKEVKADSKEDMKTMREGMKDTATKEEREIIREKNERI